jgi:hypothetical protein
MTPSCRVMNRHTAPGKQLPAASNDGDRNAIERAFAELGGVENERDSSLSRRGDLHNDFERAARSFAKARTEFERAGGDIYHRREELRASIESAGADRGALEGNILSLVASSTKIQRQQSDQRPTVLFATHSSKGVITSL